jgi:prepilin-type N-terminal cleavage/methylation domain-containing protein
MTRQAFTLAEMMIVLLVMTIILAAFAPLMTRRMKSNMPTGGSGGESLWAELATNGPGIYYGTGNAENVIIGAATKATTDNARLILKKGTAAQNHIIFKNEIGTANAGLYIDGLNMYFGGVPADKSIMNTGFGIEALRSNTTGNSNTGVGYEALYSNTTGSDNTGVGYEALYSNTTGVANTGVGHYALHSNTTASFNTGVGYYALNKNTTGTSNTGMGSWALQSNTTGYYNAGFGHQALLGNTTGNSNTGVGYGALYSNSTGNSNTGVGRSALQNNTTGNDNAGLGAYALYSTTTGYSNTGVGSSALRYNTTGHNNTGLGSSALSSNITGGNNTALGNGALQNNTTGSENTGVGDRVLRSNTTGIRNTGVGLFACQYVTSGSNKTCIGYRSGPAESTTGITSEAEQVWIGTSYSTVYIPGSLEVSGTAVTSDKRLKNIKGENTSGLEKIKQIKVFNYTLKDDKEKTPRVGVIAQDLQKIFPDAVSKGYEGFLAVRTEDILYALVNAVKELDKKIDAAVVSVKEQCRILKRVQDDAAAVQTRVAKLEKENQQLKAQNKALEARLSKLEAKISK